MSRSWQYFVASHADTFFWLLLALHPRQHNAIFSLVMIFASLIMCSQLAEDLAETFGGTNSKPQYTQALSLSRTSLSSHAGIFQLFAIGFQVRFMHNAASSRGSVV